LRSRWHDTPTTDPVVATAGPAAADLRPSPSPAASSEPKDPRWQRLAELIAKLPPDKADKLRAMLDGDGLVMTNSPGFGQILQALELRRGDRDGSEPLMRRICQMLEPFLVSRETLEGTGVIRRQSLVAWWEASMAQSPALGTIDQQYQRACREKITAEMERLEEEAMAELARRAKTLTLRNAAPSTLEDIRRIGTVLAGGMPLAKALVALRVDGPVTETGIELDSVLVRRFARAYEALGADRRFDPVWLGHAVMNHLTRPWEVVTLIHRVTGSTDIQMLEQTELAPLIDRAISQLVAVAEQVTRTIEEAARLKQAEAIELAGRRANLYFDLVESIAREIKFERTSQWGQTYAASRKALSDLISGKLGDFEGIIADFLAAWNPDEPDGDDHPDVVNTMAAADFIGAMQLRATRHGFGMALAHLERRMQDALGRPMKRPADGGRDPWPARKRQLLACLRLG
jgi:hypothetical protein